MSLFSKLFRREDGKKSLTDIQTNVLLEPQSSVADQDMEELIAVLTAAVAACTGQPADRIVVRNVLRVPDGTPTWARSGLVNQMNMRRSH